MTQDLETQIEILEYSIMSAQELIGFLVQLEFDKNLLISSSTCTQQDIDQLDYHINHIKKLLSE